MRMAQGRSGVLTQYHENVISGCRAQKDKAPLEGRAGLTADIADCEEEQRQREEEEGVRRAMLGGHLCLLSLCGNLSARMGAMR